MALNHKQLLALMKATIKADSSKPVSYSVGGQELTYEGLNATLRKELNELAGTYSLYRRNQLEIFELMEETLDEVLPKKVMEQYGQFAVVKTFAQGDQPVFKEKLGRTRAKQFITKVGLAGVYETFKLGTSSFTVETAAIGGAAQIGLEEFLDGRVDFSELTEILLDGLDEAVYTAIAESLIASIAQLPAANKKAEAFDADNFDAQLDVVSAYGAPAIFCTLEFARTNLQPVAANASDRMKDLMYDNGIMPYYKGSVPIVILPQSWTDETNTTKVIDPSYAWIFPTGADRKPVRVAFEGNTIVQEYKNRDSSREIQIYKKFGVATIATNDICSYRDSSLIA